MERSDEPAGAGSSTPAENQTETAALETGTADVVISGKAMRDLQLTDQAMHMFWDKQPVGICTNAQDIGPIDIRTVEEVRNKPYKLPHGFDWCLVDLDNPSELEEVRDFLRLHYVEDDDNQFRFNYSGVQLKWALQPPDHKKEWVVGIRATSTNNQLLAFVSAVPANLKIYGKELPSVEVNFLCVHKHLRKKRLATVLIKEITRRVNLLGVWHAIFTAGHQLPMSIAKAQYFHRAIRPRKLCRLGFSALPHRMTMQHAEHIYRVIPKVVEGMREMMKKDCAAVQRLLTERLATHAVAPVFTLKEIRHYFLPRDKVVHSYILVVGGEITDFISFYLLPTTALLHQETLVVAYSYYHVNTSLTLVQLMDCAFHYAEKLGADVFNALNIGNNRDAIDALKFAPGDGHLHYYLYNYRVPPMSPKDLCVVLI